MNHGVPRSCYKGSIINTSQTWYERDRKVVTLNNSRRKLGKSKKYNSYCQRDAPKSKHGKLFGRGLVVATIGTLNCMDIVTLCYT